MKKILALLLTLISFLGASAQNTQPIPSLMEGHLKLYVVVAVLTIIFTGIIIFLLTIDSRLKKLEKGK